MDNAAWFKANLSLVQQRADVWEQQDRPESLLLRGQELAQARLWAEDHQAELLPSEVDYLAGSQEQAIRALRLRRRNQVILVLGIASMLLAFVASLAFRTAARERDLARRQERLARAGQLAAQSQAALQAFPPRSMLLAVEALSVTLKAGEPRLANAENALRGALSDPHGIPLPGHTGEIKALAFSPECGGSLSAPGGAVPGTAARCGHWLATGSDDNTVRLWSIDATDGAASPLILSGHENRVTALAFSPEGRWLASGSADQTLRLWDLPRRGSRCESPGSEQPGW